MSPEEAQAFSGFSSFTESDRQAVRDVLAMISEVTNLTFVEVPDNGLEPGSSNPRITFANSTTMPDNRLGLASTTWNSANVMAGATVFINETEAMYAGLRGYATLTHEILHALGLKHPGNYGELGGPAPTYEADAIYYQDSLQYTVMSYFSASNTGADHGIGTGNDYSAVSPLLHDVAALQFLYGTNNSTRAGNTIYGVGNNTGNQSFSLTGPNAITIWDSGGIDTLNLSHG
jgi:serralysin